MSKESNFLSELRELPLIVQREIEARILGPILRDLFREFGEERVRKVVKKTVSRLSQEEGRRMRQASCGNTLHEFSLFLKDWQRNGAMEIEMLEKSANRLLFNVTRCAYAQLYFKLGMEQLGTLLSCDRDFARIRGFHPGGRLCRSQTIMEGAPYCDFRFMIENC